MRYNPDTNRCRNVNAQALGRLLDSDAPINCYGNNNNGSGCIRDRQSMHDMNNMNMHGMHNGCMNTNTTGAKLASSCSSEPSLAMVYSPYQHFQNIYNPYEALCHGTLFRELDKPWKGGGCR